MSHAKALEELREHAGTQFDPAVVKVFCDVYADGVPPDGLEEVYRLHERARDGVERLEPIRGARGAPRARPRKRTSSIREAAG